MIYIVNSGFTFNDSNASKMKKIYFNKWETINKSDVSTLKSTLTHVEFGGGVKEIADSTFKGTHKLLGEIYIGSSVAKIGRWAFSLSSNSGKLNYLYFDANIDESILTTISASPLNANRVNNMTLEIGNNVKKVANYLFGSSSETMQISKILFEENSVVSELGMNVFSYSQITEITLQQSLSNIYGTGASAPFTNCSNLQTIYWHGEIINLNPVGDHKVVVGSTYTDIDANNISSWTYNINETKYGSTNMFTAYMRKYGTNSSAKNVTVNLIGGSN